MRIAVPDLVSNSYFPAVAAIELGFFRAQGMDVELEMVFPVGRAMEALRDRRVDFVAGPAHATLSAFPGWQGAKLLVALSQHTFWLLVLRSDLEVRPGDVAAVKGLRIGAAPGPDTALRRLLAEAGVDPAAAKDFTFAALVTTDRLIEDSPAAVEAAVRAVVEAQRALRADPSQAVAVGQRLFPPDEAGLIEDLVRRDTPYYAAEISPTSVTSLNEFSRNVGLLSGDVAYEQVVATRFAHIWSEQ